MKRNSLVIVSEAKLQPQPAKTATQGFSISDPCDSAHHREELSDVGKPGGYASHFFAALRSKRQ
jgi:hypothetical protein